ncbi:MAG: adenylyltransferase/cytidyltransferase family protein [Candidatus Levybacteria bacterium]|nr:adenylyltransferase/cytidyltransferase family protein [Candidatus Levybacteria bacterium]MBP9815069.1 adenylyltransferase/cytidyltransferase family protein [Candidatus Levybacteria bacterium]
MAKYKKALIVGRFQPFHLGHKYLIEKALELADTVIIGLGSSNITDDKNPFSLETRKSFIQEFLIQEKLNSKILEIIPIEDVPNDDEWMRIIEGKVKEIDVVIGDNDWVNGIFEKRKIPVVKIGYLKRHILTGTEIRKNMKEKKSWEERVPSYLVPYIKNAV